MAVVTVRPTFRSCLPASLLACVLLLAGSARVVGASGIGHYNGGLLNVRDYFMPAHGAYGLLYNHFYSTDRFNDADGERVDVVTVHPGPGPGIPLALDLNAQAYIAAPTLMLVRELKPNGLKLGASITPTFANVGLDAVLTTAIDRSGSVQGGAFGLGDLFVRPAWLALSTSRWELGASYGFYAPVGEYETEHFDLGVGQPIKTVAPGNLGHGFWTHQFQGVVGLYPKPDRATALMAALTYELNGNKEGFDLTPGANMTVNWGATHYLPVQEGRPLRWDLGVAGYDTWQVTDDTGADARTGRAEVHTAGWQLGFTHLPTGLWVDLHGFYDYSAKLRLAGSAYSLSIGGTL